MVIDLTSHCKTGCLRTIKKIEINFPKIFQFHHAADAKKAMEQLNGFELAGRPMKVGNVTERTDGGSSTRFDADELDRAGIDLGATGRLQLMFKLAEGTGLQVKC